MRLILLILVLSCCVFFLGYYGASILIPVKETRQAQIATDTPTPTIQQPLNSEKLFEIIQDWRTSENRSKYIKDERLCKIALDRVDDPQLDYHQGLYDKYSSNPYVIQENLGRDFSEQQMLDGWLNSPAHAETLRKPYSYTCLECLDNYCVQIFSNFSRY